MRKLLLFTLFALIAVSVNAQETAELSASADNTLYEDAQGNTSNGLGTYLFAGKTNQSSNALRRALLSFDIAAEIPAEATIESVTLTLQMTKSRAGDFDFEIYAVSRDWGEGTSNANASEGSGASATSGDATWTDNFFGASQWSNAGGDFSGPLLSTQTVGGNGSYVWPSSTEFVSTVQSWLDNPDENFGLIIIGGEDASGRSAKRFNSRENNANRPVLTVQYTTNSVNTEEENEIPAVAELNQNFPNPFNPTTNISFALPEAAEVQLNVYDIVGRQVATVFSGFRSAGSHTFTFDATSLSSGIYIYTLESAAFMLSRKFTLIK